MRVRRVAGMALAGLAVLAVGVVVLAPFFLSQVVAFVNAFADGFVWLVQALEEGRGGWEVTMAALQAIGSSMTSPGVVGGIVAFELLALAALYGIDRLLSRERRDAGPDGLDKREGQD